MDPPSGYNPFRRALKERAAPILRGGPSPAINNEVRQGGIIEGPTVFLAAERSLSKGGWVLRERSSSLGAQRRRRVHPHLRTEFPAKEAHPVSTGEESGRRQKLYREAKVYGYGTGVSNQ